MASHQVLFAETIAGMKKAFKRKAYDSDSDSAIENYGNRGHKLKKRALFARQGQLAPTQGPSSYRESVDYAGTRRAIIHRNRPVLDEDGYEIDSEDDDERIEEAELAAAELDPYSSIRLEHLLAPLTAATDLPIHSTLSRAFNARSLSNLVSHSCDMLRRENNTLWRIRHLLTRLCGDSTWVPCGRMVGPNDVNLYREDHVARHFSALNQPSDADVLSSVALNGDARDERQREARNTNKNSSTASMNDAIERREERQIDDDVSTRDAGQPAEDRHRVKEEGIIELTAPDLNYLACGTEGKRDSAELAHKRPGEIDGNRDEVLCRIVSSADIQASGPEGVPKIEIDAAAGLQGDALERAAPSASPNPEQEFFIHPLFHTPSGVRWDRDAGLPPNEAAEVRKLLLLFVQKQEEVSRGTERLHQGLLKAERLKKEVLHWSKAEAHCGANRDLSDGEDWYDKEEWGLEEDLKKGQDEEEEDTTTTGKKTRTRR